MSQWGKRGTALNLVQSFCRLQDMTFYVYTKSRSGHPRKFIDCEDLVDIQPGSLAMNEFRLIDKNKHEYKLRAYTQDDFNAWVKAFQAALARRKRAANKAVKVWFMDISNVSIIIERGVTTAEDVRLNHFGLSPFPSGSTSSNPLFVQSSSCGGSYVKHLILPTSPEKPFASGSWVQTSVRHTFCERAKRFSGAILHP